MWNLSVKNCVVRRLWQSGKRWPVCNSSLLCSFIFDTSLGTWSISKAQRPLQNWWAAPDSAFPGFIPSHTLVLLELNCDRWGFNSGYTKGSRARPLLFNTVENTPPTTYPLQWGLSPKSCNTCRHFLMGKAWQSTNTFYMILLFVLTYKEVGLEMFHFALSLLLWFFASATEIELQYFVHILCCSGFPPFEWAAHAFSIMAVLHFK